VYHVIYSFIAFVHYALLLHPHLSVLDSMISMPPAAST